MIENLDRFPYLTRTAQLTAVSSIDVDTIAYVTAVGLTLWMVPMNSVPSVSCLLDVELMDCQLRLVGLFLGQVHSR